MLARSFELGDRHHSTQPTRLPTKYPIWASLGTRGLGNSRIGNPKAPSCDPPKRHLAVIIEDPLVTRSRIGAET